ncbi:hypothetical protein NC655_25820, partial [Comamonas thiooxydans]|nr:hypothetical protein [Comamonas thiooxydans]
IRLAFLHQTYGTFTYLGAKTSSFSVHDSILSGVEPPRKPVRFNGIWMHEGGSMLSTVQRLFDHEALFHIMRRLEMRAEIDELQSPDVEEVMALADTVAFRRIQDLPAQQSAASVIAVHARSNPLYREALKRALPRLDIYGKVQELTGVGLDPDEIPF